MRCHAAYDGAVMASIHEFMPNSNLSPLVMEVPPARAELRETWRWMPFPAATTDDQEVGSWSDFIWEHVNACRILDIHKPQSLKVPGASPKNSVASGSANVCNQAHLSTMAARIRYNEASRGSNPLNGLHEIETGIEARNILVCIGIPCRMRGIHSRANKRNTMLEELGLLVRGWSLHHVDRVIPAVSTTLRWAPARGTTF